ncbi:hypothetical protein FOCC_FOCC014901 [Frankliniella occidentalis]|nr:hypothetical protein FOCC_FOCC014901 [Frankliniella occidentalis]
MKVRPKSHSEMNVKLNDTVYKQIKPVYQRLASKELLGRCLSGGTQNVNECLHSVIWTKQPKGRFVSRNRLEWSITLAVSEFNMGCSATHSLLAEVDGREVTEASEVIAERRDTRRKRKSEGQKEATAKRAKKRLNKKKSKKTDQQDYGVGKF